jgi:hypothetical protein
VFDVVAQTDAVSALGSGAMADHSLMADSEPVVKVEGAV